MFDERPQAIQSSAVEMRGDEEKALLRRLSDARREPGDTAQQRGKKNDAHEVRRMDDVVRDDAVHKRMPRAACDEVSCNRERRNDNAHRKSRDPSDAESSEGIRGADTDRQNQ